MTDGHAIAVVVPDGTGTGSRVHYIHAPSIRDFADGVIGALMDGGTSARFDFALGFVAAIDGLSKDAIDFSNPVATVEAAEADLAEVGELRAMVTDALRNYCERIGAAR